MNNKNISKNRYEAIYEEMLKKKKQSAINALNSARKEAFDNVPEAAAQNTVPKDNVIKKQTPDFSFTMPKNITKQQSANTGKVLYLAPWDEKQSDESLYNVMKGMNSELGGLFDKTLGEYEAEQRNFKEKVKRLTDDYNKKMAQIMRTNTADKAQNTAVKYSDKAYGEGADRPNLYAANTKNYTAPQAPSASFKQAENTKDSLRLQYANSGRNYVPQSKNIQGNYAQNNENNNTNLLNFAYAGDMIKDRKTNEKIPYAGQNSVRLNETVLPEDQDVPTRPEAPKKDDYDDVYEFMAAYDNYLAELHEYNKRMKEIERRSRIRYPDEPIITSAANTEEQDRNATGFWREVREKREEQEEMEKNIKQKFDYINFLMGPEPKWEKDILTEEYSNLVTAYWHDRAVLLANRQIQKENEEAVIEVMQINPLEISSEDGIKAYEEILTNLGIEDYIYDEPYIWPIELDFNAVTSGYGDSGDVVAGTPVDYSKTTVMGTNKLENSDTPGRLLVDTTNGRTYIDENNLYRVRKIQGVTNDEEDYYCMAIPVGIFDEVKKFTLNKNNQINDGNIYMGMTYQMILEDKDGKRKIINVVQATEKASLDENDFYPHDHIMEFVAKDGVPASRISKTNDKGNIDLNKLFKMNGATLVGLNYIVNGELVYGNYRDPMWNFVR